MNKKRKKKKKMAVRKKEKSRINHPTRSLSPSPEVDNNSLLFYFSFSPLRLTDRCRVALDARVGPRGSSGQFGGGGARGGEWRSPERENV